jgi:hypothetical protein
LIISMDDTDAVSLGQIRAFLAASGGCGFQRLDYRACYWRPPRDDPEAAGARGREV